MDGWRLPLIRNGSTSTDGHEETRALPVPAPNAETPPIGDKKSSAKRRTNGHRAARRRTEVIRYFVGKGSDPKPMLEQEVASEAEALVGRLQVRRQGVSGRGVYGRAKDRTGEGEARKAGGSRTTSFYHQRKLSRRRPRLAWTFAFEVG